MNVPPPPTDSKDDQTGSDQVKKGKGSEKESGDGQNQEKVEVGDGEAKDKESKDAEDQQEAEEEKEETMFIPEDYLRLVGWYLKGIQGGAKDVSFETFV